MTSISTQKRVVIAGTFDILHPGHIYLIREASKLGSVTVVVSRDTSVQKIKGRPPIVPERQRRMMISQLQGVDQAILGNEGEDHLAIIEQLNPDILLLGPDQIKEEDKIEAELQHRGLHVKIRRVEECDGEFPLCRSSKIKKKIVEEFCQEKRDAKRD